MSLVLFYCSTKLQCSFIVKNVITFTRSNWYKVISRNGNYNYVMWPINRVISTNEFEHNHDVIAYLHCLFSSGMFISISPYHLRMTSILFQINMYCRFLSISRLVNWVISDRLVHKGLKNQKIVIVIDMLVDFIMRLVLLRNRTLGFLMFNSLCITFVLVWMLNVSLWILTKIL